MTTYNERTERIQEKAKEQKLQLRRKRKIRIISIASVAAAILLTLNLTLFIPYQTGGYDISKYKKSEYYALMNAIGGLTYSKPRTTNNFKQWFGGGVIGTPSSDANMMAPSGPQGWPESNKGDAAPESPGSSGSSNSESSTPPYYEEVTNNQVNGVIEGDLFKRSNEYIWYLSYRGFNGYTLRAYSIAQKTLVSEYAIFAEEGTMFGYFVGSEEMFLSADASTVTVIAMCRTTGTRMLYTEAINIDVSDPFHPVETGRKYVAGGYVSARLTNGTLLLVTAFHLGRRPNFEKPEEYLPQAGDIDSLDSLPMRDIFLPQNPDSAQYTVLVSLDETTLEIQDSAALFSYTSEIYVSADYLFAARTKWETMEQRTEADVVEGGTFVPSVYGYRVNSTEITCYSYGKDFIDYRGTVTAKGTIVDQYSMDEYKNVLRVFTTSRNDLLYSSYTGTGKEEASIKFDVDECNFYAFELENFSMITSVENFSDPEESVKSVRFDGEKAYVCTAKVEYNYNFGNNYQLFEPIITDPVFEFDLSDYGNITWKDTGTISGYSMSLIKFYDDTLLGIGYGDDYNTLKIEVYRTEESSVLPVARFEMDVSYFSDKFKAYFIDAEHGLIGLGIYQRDRTTWTTYRSYLLLRFDGEEFNVAQLKELEEYSYNFYDFMRACYIDGKVFVLGENTFETIPVD